jgi:hypothetical protein
MTASFDQSSRLRCHGFMNFSGDRGLRHVRRCDGAVIASSQRLSSSGLGTGSLSQPDVSIEAPAAARSSPMSEA